MRGRPVLPAIGGEQVGVHLFQVLERGRFRRFGIAEQGEDTQRHVAAFDPDEIEFQQRQVGRFPCRVLADDDVDAIGARQTLQPRGDVRCVPDDRIVEALLRAHVADAGAATVEADAGGEDDRLSVGHRRFGSQRLVQPLEFGPHLQRRLQGETAMAGYVERRVPECHHAVAHILVNEAAGLLDDIRERRQESVDQSGQFLGIELFGNPGEAADVGEQDREIAHAPAEHQKLGMAAQLVDQDRRHVAAERVPHEALLALRPNISEQRAGEIDEQDHEAGKERVDQIGEMGEAIPGDSDCGSGCGKRDQQ
jgi:hypothetical protein